MQSTGFLAQVNKYEKAPENGWVQFFMKSHQDLINYKESPVYVSRVRTTFFVENLYITFSQICFGPFLTGPLQINRYIWGVATPPVGSFLFLDLLRKTIGSRF